MDDVVQGVEVAGFTEEAKVVGYAVDEVAE